MGDDTIYRQRQVELAESFRAQLDPILRDLTEKRSVLESGDYQSSVYRELRNTAHKLAGSAGIFGFQEVAVIAVDAEGVLAKVDGLGVSGDQYAAVIEAIEALIESIEKALK